MTNVPGLMLGIHTADCTPVYLVDPVRKAIALLHSGRKSTEAGITPRAVRLMAETYGTAPADLIMQVGPCIRPPLFEVDIASMIVRDAIAAGVPASQIHDCGTCTGAEISRYYSYRVEQGKTGRLLALLGLRP
jgi:copper oxidase (laccase) domain-containing protein